MRNKRLLGALALVLVCVVAFVWLFTLDVYVGARNVDGAPAFCGSAYDVALIKRDGFMGGEVPTNQAAIDSACTSESRRDMVLAGLAAMGALGGAICALRLRPRTQTPVGLR